MIKIIFRLYLLMQQTRPLAQEPEALPPSLIQAPLSSQIPVSLLGDVQLVNGTNTVPQFLLKADANYVSKISVRTRS
jgi:hypothetical protein